MANPILCEVTRGNLVESCHRGAVAVVDADGAKRLSIGDIETPVFPRSAVKAIQALPLIESGAADALGFGERELALVCSSHSGEAEHVELAAAMLQRAGLDETALECGAHRPTNGRATRELIREGAEPTSLHNNCSGKHAGFICTCAHRGIDRAGYVRRDHDAQKTVTAALEEVIGAAHSVDLCGTDGCSIPTHAVPLKNLARGFARMATGTGFARERAAAAGKLFEACMNQPFLVAGTGRACTKFMEAAPGQVFAKTGAEGVYCGAVPELGLGIALKCDDGATRAAEIMFAAVVAKLLDRDESASAAFRNLANVELNNWNKWPVGTLRATGELSV